MKCQLYLRAELWLSVSFLPLFCVLATDRRGPRVVLCDQPTLLGPAGFRVHYVNKDLKAVTSAI